MFKQNRLYCFSPPAMLATFFIEVVLAAYAFAKYKMTSQTRLVAAVLLSLAAFQLAEFSICGRSSQSAMMWSRVGYVAITLLPPMVLHLITLIANKKALLLKAVAYGTSILFIATFAFSSIAFVSHVCTSNYAIFELANNLGGLYFTYYYFWLFVGIALCLKWGMSSTKKVRRALTLQTFGYLSFLLPTGVANSINPKTLNGIPSIMCGFAVTYAVILAVGVLPAIAKPKPNPQIRL